MIKAARSASIKMQARISGHQLDAEVTNPTRLRLREDLELDPRAPLPNEPDPEVERGVSTMLIVSSQCYVHVAIG